MLDHTTDLKSLLTNPNLLRDKAFLGGDWLDASSGKKFEVTNPARGIILCVALYVIYSNVRKSRVRKSKEYNVLFDKDTIIVHRLVQS